jgi:hypothetical protein
MKYDGPLSLEFTRLGEIREFCKKRGHCFTIQYPCWDSCKYSGLCWESKSGFYGQDMKQRNFSDIMRADYPLTL